MGPLLNGFADELEKLGAADDFERQMRKALRDARSSGAAGDEGQGIIDALRGKGRPVSRDYLAATILGALATPAAALATKAVSRGLHNRSVIKALKSTSSKRQKSLLQKQLQAGPAIGPNVPKAKAGLEPLMTHAELGGQATRGALYGSVLQMLRDRFSGSAGVGDR